MGKLDNYIRSNTTLSALFITRDNKIVIGQFPNKTLWAAGILYTSAPFVPAERRQWVQGGSIGLTMIWSIRELGWGVNLWRRLIGGGTLAIELNAVRRRLDCC